MKRIISAAVAAGWLASPALADYQRIGPGLELKQAQAYCNIASMGVGQGYYASGSTAFVAGAAIGNALGNLILQSEFMTNCMTLQGWEDTKPVYHAPKYKGNWVGGDNTGSAKKN